MVDGRWLNYKKMTLERNNSLLTGLDYEPKLQFILTRVGYDGDAEIASGPLRWI